MVLFARRAKVIRVLAPVICCALVIATTTVVGAPLAHAATSGSPSAVSVSPSTTAAGASQVSYTVAFTASAGGALAAGTGTVTLALPAGSAYNGSVGFDDVTSGATGSIFDFQGSTANGGATLTVPVSIGIAGGDQVTATYTAVTSPSGSGQQTASFSTSSDTTAAAAQFTLTAGDQQVASFGGVTVSSTAAGASGVTYTMEYTASPTGQLVQNTGTITVAAPAGTSFNGNIGFDDLTSGATGGWFDFQGTTSNNGATFTITSNVPVAAGDRVRLTFTDITSTATPGAHQITFSTSSDTRPATASFALTAGDQQVASFGGITVSSTAAGASQVTYTMEYTASATGQLVQNNGLITVAAPAGTSFNGNIGFDDLTSGATGGWFDFQGTTSNNGATFTISSNVDVAAGDKVKLTFTDITSTATAGTHQITFSTSSDTKPVTASFALTTAHQVAAPTVAISTQQPGATATYTATFTTSPSGQLVAGNGEVLLAAPAGTDFSSAAFSVADLTTGQVFGHQASVSNGGATASIAAPVDFGAGDQIKITATGVTNPTASGHVALQLSTTSDPVPAAGSYIIGDSPPIFTAASPPGAASAGAALAYTFVTTGYPAAAYSLSGAPSWLHIQPGSGQLSGTIPAGTKSFSYTVHAVNGSGSALEGPFTVVVGSGASISGTVQDTSANPVANVIVDACDPTGGTCESVTTDDTGAFALSVLAGSTVVLTAYPPAGSGEATTSTAAIKVPAAGLTSLVLTTQAGIPPITGSLKINGTSSPVVNWATPSAATLTGCANGLATVTVAGENTATGKPATNVTVLTETPAGSGFYTGTVPPQEPVHGPVDIYSTLWCPTDSALQPDLGPASGGTSVILTGSGFTGTTAVDFGGTPARSYSVVSDDAIQAVAPPGTGTVPVTVHDGSSPGGDVVGQFTNQAITSVSPSSGPVKGSTWVIIHGTGLASASDVLFGKQAAEEYYVLSDTELEALSPPGTGTQDIAVATLDGGTTPVTSAGQFTYGTQAATARRPATPAAASAAALPELRAAAARVRLHPDSLINLDAIIAWVAAHAEGLGEAQDVAEQAQNLAESADPDTTCQQSAQHLATAMVFALQGVIGTEAALAAFALEGTVLLLFPPAGLLGVLLIPAMTAAIDAVFSKLAYSYIWGALSAINCQKKDPDNGGGGGGGGSGGGGGGVPGSPGSSLPDPPINPPDPPGNPSTLPYPHCFLHPSDCGQPDGYIDPSGTVLDTHGHPVKGATVTILRSYTEDGGYLPASPSQPGLIPAQNPETTAANGAFHWDVSAGFYKVEASAPGCTAPGSTRKTAVIGPYPVPPPRTGLTITLACMSVAKAAAPSVLSLSRAFGPPAGGTTVTVLGTSFTPASAVTFGTARAKEVTYLSPQALTVVSPKGAGLADLRVRTAGGTSAKTGADRFFFGTSPAITKLSPSGGPVAGGTKVTITGRGFTGTTRVSFGGIAVKSFSVKSPTRIQAVTGKGIAGPAFVQVTNPAGSNALSAAAAFRYLAPVTAYVATSAGVVPVNPATGRKGKVIKVAGASGLAAAPEGQTLYVTSPRGLTPVSTAAGQAGSAVAAGTGPRAVAVTPDGEFAYVVSTGSGTVTPVSTTTGLAGKPIKAGSKPDAIAIAPNGKTAYVVDGGSGTVTPVTIASGQAGHAVKVGASPDAIAITPSGKFAYVANGGSGTVTEIALATGKVSATIKVGQHPDAIAITPSGKTAYVANGGSGTISQVSVATSKVSRSLKVGRNPVGVAVTPDGKTLCVIAAGAGTLILVSVASGRTARTISVGRAPAAIAVAP